MAGIRFTDEQVSLLRSNPWVKSATPKYVSFTQAFMEEFVDLHSKGLTRYEIFESHGLPVDVLGKPSVENTTKNWIRKANKSIALSDEMIKASNFLPFWAILFSPFLVTLP